MPTPGARPVLRRAADGRIETKAQPGQAHRSAAGAMIDYRLQELTGSAARAISTLPGSFADKPGFASPWHYHGCDLQVAIVLEGSIELGYRADTYARAGRGDLLFIPRPPRARRSRRAPRRTARSSGASRDRPPR